jgi:hypothetical protein
LGVKYSLSLLIRIKGTLTVNMDTNWKYYTGYSMPLNMFRYCVRFEVFTAVTMKNGVFWVVTPCGSCKNRRSGGIWRLLHQGEKIGELGATQAATSN